MKLRWLVLACAVGSSWQGRAQACSVVLPQQQSVVCPQASAGAGGSAPSSVAQARLELDAVEIQRSSYAPPGRGDCGELGSARLRFHLAGSSAWPADVGVLLTLREGQSSYFAPPLSTIAGTSGWLLLPQSGSVRLFGPDDPRTPLALRLEARAVDCSGALSAPTEVLITHPGRSDAGAGAPDATPPAPGTVVSEAPGAVAPEAQGAAGTAALQASRAAPTGGSCAVCSVRGAVCSVRGAARGADRSGLVLGLSALALGALRRRRR